VQLCAQAICIEEMLDVHLFEGLLFYGQTRRREAVTFSSQLRQRTTGVVEAFRDMLTEGILPPPQPGRKCKSCSLRDACLPDRTGTTHASRYMKRMLTAALGDQSESDSP
jgi:CRISPR-associated exonuclease Cas4